MARPDTFSAREALKLYSNGREPADSDFPLAIQDLIADLLHLGDDLNAEVGPDPEWDAELTIALAQGHYDAEVAGDD